MFGELGGQHLNRQDGMSSFWAEVQDVRVELNRRGVEAQTPAELRMLGYAAQELRRIAKRGPPGDEDPGSHEVALRNKAGLFLLNHGIRTKAGSLEVAEGQGSHEVAEGQGSHEVAEGKGSHEVAEGKSGHEGAESKSGQSNKGDERPCVDDDDPEHPDYGGPPQGQENLAYESKGSQKGAESKDGLQNDVYWDAWPIDGMRVYKPRPPGASPPPHLLAEPKKRPRLVCESQPKEAAHWGGGLLLPVPGLVYKPLLKPVPGLVLAPWVDYGEWVDFDKS